MWVTEYSSNVSVRYPPNCVAKFAFPTKDGIHMLTDYVTGRGSYLEAKFEILGTEPLHFVSVDRVTPPLVPNCSLYFQHKDDNMRTDGMRWWSRSRFELRLAAAVTLKIPLDPVNWYTVYGGAGDKDQQHKNWFRGSVTNMGRWGITFGGDFPAHGVYETSGTSKFKLRSFRAL